MTKNKYNVGDVVRCGNGSTSLMEISFIVCNHGGFGKRYYYGKHCLGGIVATYEDNIMEITRQDRKTWVRYNLDTELS